MSQKAKNSRSLLGAMHVGKSSNTMDSIGSDNMAARVVTRELKAAVGRLAGVREPMRDVLRRKKLSKNGLR